MNGSTKKLLAFQASWCQPCHLMEPVIDELSKKFEVEKINVDENEVKAASFNVMSVPTYVVMDGAKEVARFTGMTGKEELVKALRV